MTRPKRQVSYYGIFGDTPHSNGELPAPTTERSHNCSTVGASACLVSREREPDNEHYLRLKVERDPEQEHGTELTCDTRV